MHRVVVVLVCVLVEYSVLAQSEVRTDRIASSARVRACVHGAEAGFDGLVAGYFFGEDLNILFLSGRMIHSQRRNWRTSVGEILVHISGINLQILLMTTLVPLQRSFYRSLIALLRHTGSLVRQD